MTTLVVLDATSLVFRHHYGGAADVDADGAPVGAVLGVVRMVLQLLRKAKARHFIAVFDGGGHGVRHDLYPAYKQGRKAPPPEIPLQLTRSAAVLAALGFPVLRRGGVEADDLIAGVVAHGRDHGCASWVVSPDKDLLQLVQDAPPTVRCFRWFQKRTLDGAAVVDQFGVQPRQIPDLLALAGDSSDNIPGVRGVGPKAAVAILGALGSLEAALADPDAVAGLGFRGAKRAAGLLSEHAEDARLSLELVRLRPELAVELPADPVTDWRYRGPGADAAAAMLALGVPGLEHDFEAAQ